MSAPIWFVTPQIGKHWPLDLGMGLTNPSVTLLRFINWKKALNANFAVCNLASVITGLPDYETVLMPKSYKKGQIKENIRYKRPNGYLTTSTKFYC